MYSSHNLQFFLKTDKPPGNCGFFLCKETNLRRSGICFRDKTLRIT